MKIKKVDDKPMVIHTKKKAKLHTHEPKKASIKASNIYTVDRSHSSAQDHNDVTDQKATKRDADIDIGFRPFTDISVQKNK